MGTDNFRPADPTPVAPNPAPQVDGRPMYDENGNPYAQQINGTPYVPYGPTDPNWVYISAGQHPPTDDSIEWADNPYQNIAQHAGGNELGKELRDAEDFAGPHHAGPYNPDDKNGGFGDTSPWTDPTDYMFGGYKYGAEDFRQMYDAQATAAQNRVGPQMDNSAWLAARGQDIQGRQAQTDATAAYAAMANGSGPSMAGAQMAQARDQGVAAQLAAGGNPYAAAMAGAGRMQAANAQLGQARGQELSAAMAGQAGASSALTQGNMQRYGLSQQNAFRQADLDLQQRARNDAMAQMYGNLSYGVSAAQLKAAQQFESQEAYSRLTEKGLLNQVQQARQVAETQQRAAAIGAGAAVGASVMNYGGGNSAPSGPDYSEYDAG
ncbi:MAG: hypothetical protein JOZ73_11995 [Solirubrobacterales bacterium]|nr:hypothetical protein [Solirubrobacterales bacterium]